jgi:hypothetical protein
VQTTNEMTKHSLALLTLLLAGAACEAPTAPGEIDTLIAARALWRARVSDSYTFTVNRGCFCVLGGQTVTVTVSNGAVTTAEYESSGAAVDKALLTYVSTVPDLFDLIQSAIDAKPAQFAATYDPVYGYPTRIEVDYSANVVDDELAISARNLTLSGSSAR